MSISRTIPRIAISVGDPNGIGSEILLKLLMRKDVLEVCTPIICASKKYWKFVSEYFKFQKKITFIESSDKIVDGRINLLNSIETEISITFGKANSNCGLFSFESLQVATNLVSDLKADCLLTAPINKDTIQGKDFNFPGHTEYLEDKWGGEALMFMVEEDLKVGLVTQHIPLKDVVSTIDSKLLNKKINGIFHSLQLDFSITKPKVAVLSINPHASDNGLIGKEEEEILIPFIKRQNEKANLVFGPYPSDSFFSVNNIARFDAVLAMYHDQGLIPFKTIAGLKGVNYTAGLPFVRTSPDHGVGYDIAGKGLADETSMVEALYQAITIWKNRTQNTELLSNQLQPQNRRDSRDNRSKYN